jgi:ribosomal protein S18 acetylase RimI-like enzyme
MKIEVCNNPNQALIDFLDNKIIEFNHARREINERFPIAVTIKDKQDNVVAGASGKTFGHWLQLAILWVSEDFRGKNYGSKLLTEIEQVAKARGCQWCLLDTLNIQAMPFYKKHGYKVEWTQESYPLTGCKYYMTKPL